MVRPVRFQNDEHLKKMPFFYSWMLHSAVKLQKHSVDEETSKVDHGESILIPFSNISW